MSTRCPCHKNSPKMSTRIHLFCPRKFTFYVHEKSATQFRTHFPLSLTNCFLSQNKLLLRQQHHKIKCFGYSKSLYISCAVSNVHGKEFGLVFGRLVGSTKKNLGWLWATFEGGFFMFSWAKKIWCDTYQYFMNTLIWLQKVFGPNVSCIQGEACFN